MTDGHRVTGGEIARETRVTGTYGEAEPPKAEERMSPPWPGAGNCETGYRRSLDILYDVGRKVGSASEVSKLLDEIMRAAAFISDAKLHQAVLDGYKSTLKVLVAAIDAKDPSTCGHSQRVKEYVLMGASSFSFSAEELQSIEIGALLHDIGKIGVDDSILRKSHCLTQEEWLIIHEHPLIGANIISEVSFLKKAKEVVLYHHERYDGAGYPEGLKGENIPIGARLVAVADAFDTMTTDRSYRPSQSAVDALRELGRFAGRQFCPTAVAAFVSTLKKHREMLTESRAGGRQLPALS